MEKSVAIAIALILGVASAAASDSGVSGTVRISPSCPGPQRQDQPCTSPFGGAKVRLLNGAGAVAASGVTSETGTFTLHAAPGDYALEVVVNGLYPRCEDAQVTITRNRIARTDITCDSGMR